MDCISPARFAGFATQYRSDGGEFVAWDKPETNAPAQVLVWQRLGLIRFPHPRTPPIAAQVPKVDSVAKPCGVTDGLCVCCIAAASFAPTIVAPVLSHRHKLGLAQSKQVPIPPSRIREHYSDSGRRLMTCGHNRFRFDVNVRCPFLPSRRLSPCGDRLPGIFFRSSRNKVSGTFLTRFGSAKGS